MKISVIGAGNIGGNLGKKWADAGHEISFGVRNPTDSKFDNFRPHGLVIPIPEALDNSEVVLLSLPGTGMTDFATQHSKRLSGKMIIDATNNIQGDELNNIKILQEKALNALIVRAFSSLGWENFVDPQINGVTIDLFYCGQAETRPRAEQLIREIGLRPIYLGDLDTASLVDGMTRIWFVLVFGQGRSRRLVFKLMEE